MLAQLLLLIFDFVQRILVFFLKQLSVPSAMLFHLSLKLKILTKLSFSWFNQSSIYSNPSSPRPPHTYFLSFEHRKEKKKIWNDLSESAVYYLRSGDGLVNTASHFQNTHLQQIARNEDWQQSRKEIHNSTLAIYVSLSCQNSTLFSHLLMHHRSI